MKQVAVAPVLMVFMLLGCNSATVDNSNQPNPGIGLGSLAAFPTQPAPTSFSNDALLQGKLILKDGCLRVQHTELPEYAPLIYWPYGFTYREGSKGIEIFGDTGTLVAVVGDYLSIGGGEYPGDISKGRCEGPNWDAGSIDVVPISAL